MVRETYSKKDVGEYMASKFVAIKIDAEKGEGPDLAKRFGVRGFPTFVIVDPEGQEVDRLVGFRKPEPFLAELKDIAGEKSFRALKKRATENPDDLDAALDLAEKYQERSDFDQALGLYEKVRGSEKASASSKLRAEGRIAMIGYVKSRGKELGSLEKFYEAHKGGADAVDIARLLYQVYQRGEDRKKVVEMGDYLLANAPEREDATFLNDYSWYLSTKDVDAKKALELARRAVAKSPDAPAILDTLAEACYRNGLFEEAVETQKKAVKLAEESQRGEFEERLQKFEQALKEKARSARV